MKIIHFFKLSVLCAAVVLFSCKSDGDAARDAAVESINGAQPAAGDPATAAPADPATPEPAQNPLGVWHFTCPKGCEGGAGSAIACSKCGTTLAHNQAYHASGTSDPSTTLPPTSTAPNHASSLPPGMVPVESPLKTPEPAQNAKGVWHYTCASGCAGGAGSAIACAKCGKTLAHNQTYHQ